ncbi:hypothetical protein V8E52_004393 [Russula decolorans]
MFDETDKNSAVIGVLFAIRGSLAISWWRSAPVFLFAYLLQGVPRDLWLGIYYVMFTIPRENGFAQVCTIYGQPIIICCKFAASSCRFRFSRCTLRAPYLVEDAAATSVGVGRGLGKAEKVGERRWRRR